LRNGRRLWEKGFDPGDGVVGKDEIGGPQVLFELGKKNAGARKEWLEEKGNLVDL